MKDEKQAAKEYGSSQHNTHKAAWGMGQMRKSSKHRPGLERHTAWSICQHPNRHVQPQSA